MSKLLELWNHPNTSYKKALWTVQADAFHFEYYESPRFGGNLIPWICGSKTGNEKRISRRFPKPSLTGQSLAWAFLFKLDDTSASDLVDIHLFSNKPALDNSVAGYQGYGMYFDGNDVARLRRYAGGDSVTSVIDPGWTSDTLEHLCVVSRQVSGANRYWRIYLDPPMYDLFDSSYLIGGPTDDATYSAASHMGIRISTANRQRVSSLYLQW